MSIESRVASAHHGSFDKVYVGDLGQYCELVFATWVSEQGVSGISFKATDRREETLDNLHDTFEVPYWRLIADLFDDVRSNTLNSNSLPAEAILLILNTLTMEIEEHISRLRITDEANLPQPILNGISRRINALRGILDSLGFESSGTSEFSAPINVNSSSDEMRSNNDTASTSNIGENSAGVSNLLHILLKPHQLMPTGKRCLDISKLPFPGHCYSPRIQSILYIDKRRSTRERKYK